MTTRTADAEGLVTDASLAYYAARARGGNRLITVEMARRAPGPASQRELGIYDDASCRPDRLTAEIQRHGAKPRSSSGMAAATRGRHLRRDAIAPSPIPHRL